MGHPLYPIHLYQAFSCRDLLIESQGADIGRAEETPPARFCLFLLYLNNSCPACGLPPIKYNKWQAGLFAFFKKSVV